MGESHNPNDQHLISQLKSHIFELEQAEKNYNLLNTQYKSLQKEIAYNSEEHLRLEHDLKQRIDTQDRKIKELTDLNTCLEDAFNDM